MRAIQFQYRTKDNAEWIKVEAAVLMFELILAGVVAEYRVNPSCIDNLNEGAK